jgi:hypothetical protein
VPGGGDPVITALSNEVASVVLPPVSAEFNASALNSDAARSALPAIAPVGSVRRFPTALVTLACSSATWLNTPLPNSGAGAGVSEPLLVIATLAGPILPLITGVADAGPVPCIDRSFIFSPVFNRVLS